MKFDHQMRENYLCLYAAMVKGPGRLNELGSWIT
jgi:hypothetical protein